MLLWHQLWILLLVYWYFGLKATCFGGHCRYWKEGKLSPKVLSVFGLVVAEKKAAVGMSFEKKYVKKLKAVWLKTAVNI
jgi:hypothetical protein